MNTLLEGIFNCNLLLVHYRHGILYLVGDKKPIIRIIMEVAKHSSHNQRPQGKKTNILTQRLERLMSDIRD